MSKKIVSHYDIKSAASFFIGVMGFFFDPLQQLAMMALFCLILIDFVLGVSAARYTGDHIKSAKLVRTAIKVTVYFALVAAARLTEHAVPFNFLDTTVIGFLAATELLSILENTGRLGFAVPNKLVKLLGEYVSGKNDAKGITNHHKK